VGEAQAEGRDQGRRTVVKIGDDELWAMITSQELPRAAMTNDGVLYENS